jgi:hypothetical protein
LQIAAALELGMAAWSFRMKTSFVAAWTFPALLCAWAIAGAQTAPRAAESPEAPGVTSHVETPTESDPNQPASKMADPEAPTAGHDDVTGKDEITPDLTSPDSTQVEKANTKHPDFMTLDPNNHGYLTRMTSATTSGCARILSAVT